MADELSELLRATADRPTREVDPTAVVGRARRRRRAARAVVGAVTVAVVAAGTAVALPLIGDADRGIEVADQPSDDGRERTSDNERSAAAERADTSGELRGEPRTWELTGVSPDGRLLTFHTEGGGCDEFVGWVSEEGPDGVHLEARWAPDEDAGLPDDFEFPDREAPDGGELWDLENAIACPMALSSASLTLQLDEPLGDRPLTGCQGDDCAALPQLDDGWFGGTGQLSVDGDVVVVTGTDVVRSLDPTDGEVRWERSRHSSRGWYWSLAVGGVVLRYDHFDHIEALDPVTGEVVWEERDVTLAGVDGDEVVVCPREQALDPPGTPRESFRGALSLEDGSWLWRDEGASCTTDSVGQEQPEPPSVDLDPAQVGRSTTFDLAAGDGMVYVATTTAVIALDADTGERGWWTPAPAGEVEPAGGVHLPDDEDR